MLVNNMNDDDFVINEDLLSSCSHASSRHNIYLMEKKTDKDQTEKARKRKALQVELLAKKKKKELQKVAEQMVIELTRKQRKLRKEKIQMR